MALDLRRKPASKAKLTLTLIAVLAFMIQPYAGISLSNTVVGATDGESSPAPVSVIEDKSADEPSSDAVQTPEVTPKADVDQSDAPSVPNALSPSGASSTLDTFTLNMSTATASSVTPAAEIETVGAPVVDISSPADGDVVKGQVTIVGTVEEDDKLANYNLSIYPAGFDFDDGQTHSGKRLNSKVGWGHGTVYTSNTDIRVERTLDTDELDEGEYTLRLAARDAAGNGPDNGGASALDLVNITVDRTAPVVSIDSPAKDSLHSGAVDINATIKDDNLSHYYLVVKVCEGDQCEVLHKSSVNQVDRSGLDNETIFTVPNTKNGQVRVLLEAKDLAGNKDDAVSVKKLTFSMDNVAPATVTGLTIKQNDQSLGCDAFTNQRYITVDWDDNDDSDFSHYEYENRQGIHRLTKSHYSGNMGGGEGVYTYKVRSVDAAGNTSAWQSCSITYDHTGPGVSITSPATGTVSGVKGLKVTGTVDSDVSGVDQVIVAVENDTNGESSDTIRADVVGSSWTANIDSQLLPHGHDIRIVAYAKDGAKNTGETTSVSVTLDNIGPTVNLRLVRPINNGSNLTKDSVGVSREVSDSQIDYYTYVVTRNNVQVENDRKVNDQLSDTKTYSENDGGYGQYKITLTAYDKAGNSTTKDISFIIDRRNPVVTLPVSQGPVFGDEFALDGVIVEDNHADGYEYWVTGQEDKKQKTSNSRLAWDVSKFSSGTYTMNVKATDKALNSTTKTIQFYVDHTAPTVNISSITPEHPGANVPITLTGTAQDDTGITGLWISANGGAPEPIAFTPGKSVNWTYEFTDGLVLGDYRFTIFAEDGSGELRQGSITSPSMFVGPFDPVGQTSPEVPAAASRSLVSTVAPEAVVEPQEEPVTDILGSVSTETPIANTAAIAATPQGWKIFGLAWYWIFVMALAAIVAAWSLLAARRRRLAAGGVASAPFTRRRG